jgi:hypothetical protein
VGKQLICWEKEKADREINTEIRLCKLKYDDVKKGLFKTYFSK